MKSLRPVDIVGAEPLPRGRGHRLPETLEKIRQRDDLIREAARTHFPNQSQREQARKVHDALSRYQSGAWRRERTEVECPARHEGKVNRICFRVLRLRDAVPSLAAIRRAIAFREPAKHRHCETCFPH